MTLLGENPFAPRVIAGLTDGLGNQIFQFASAFALSKRLELPLDLDISWYRETPRLAPARPLSLTRIVPKEAYRNEISRGIGWRLYDRFKRSVSRCDSSSFRYGLPVEYFSAKAADKLVNIDHPVFISGYPFNYRLFWSFIPEIRRHIHSRLEAFRPHEIENLNYAFVHIRRGDFISNEAFRRRFDVLDVHYFRRAMEHFESQNGRAHWILCSDDTAEARKILPSEFHVTDSPAQSEIEELYVMAFARGGVISNSTFSFWGALLNKNPDPFIIAPGVWRTDGKPGVPLPVGWHKK